MNDRSYRCPICEKGLLKFHRGAKQYESGFIAQDSVLAIECTGDEFGFGYLLGIKSDCSIPTGSPLFYAILKVVDADKETVDQLQRIENDHVNKVAVYKADRQSIREQLEKRVAMLVHDVILIQKEDPSDAPNTDKK